jgi:hypothetical protein
MQAFPVRTVLDPGGFIVAGATKTAIFPQWLPPASALGKAIIAPLVALDDPAGPASIRILQTPAPLSANWIPPLEDLVTQAVSKGASALVITLNDPSDDLFVCNQHSHKPFAIPVALLRRADLPGLAAHIGRAAKFKISGKQVDTSAINIFGERPGIGRKIVISTPLTGWFRCGGERGPGVALWLALAEHLSKQKRPVLMLGTGSHEIGHLGMEHALQHGAPAPDDVDIWMHLGASLAATRLDDHYGQRSGQFLVGTDLTAAAARELLSPHLPTYVTGTAKTLGEAGQIIGAGHRRFIGMSGQFPNFHTPLDDGRAVDHAKLARILTGIKALLARLAQ